MKLKSRVRAAGASVTTPGGYKVLNHNQTLRVRTGLKAGGITTHERPLKVACALTANHNQTLTVRTGLKAGGIGMNERIEVIYPKK